MLCGARIIRPSDVESTPSDGRENLHFPLVFMGSDWVMAGQSGYILDGAELLSSDCVRVDT
jgi:hypothetical protein